MTLVILAVLLTCLFVVAFFSKRRFGTLGLGLAAGALLANESSSDVAMVLKQYDLSLMDFSSVTIAAMILTLLPALVLLVSGPSYENKKTAFLGAFAFALMGTMLLVGPLSSDVLIDDVTTAQVFDFIATYESMLIAGGVVLAVVDSWLTHNFRPIGKKKH